MARDIFHALVRQALEKEGWKITHDPFPLHPRKQGGLQTDLGAEKIITAEKGLERIAVEVKSFVHISILHDFLLAVGQSANSFEKRRRPRAFCGPARVRFQSNYQARMGAGSGR